MLASRMLIMGRVIHFEINADNPKRAVEFYEKVFGWNISKYGGAAEYWLVETGDQKQPGINGAIMERMGKETTINTVEVPSIDEYVKKIVKAGGKQVSKKNAIPGIGYFAYCADTEGNMFGVMQPDPKAK
jgi:predicted enzyme related to lactoylglutathione lyase